MIDYPAKPSYDCLLFLNINAEVCFYAIGSSVSDLTPRPPVLETIERLTAQPTNRP